MIHPLLLVSILMLAAPTRAAAEPEALAGLWVAEMEFGPEVEGQLEIHWTKNGAEARIGEHSALASLEGDTIRFELDGQLGSFRGERSEDASAIRGHWIQPPSTGLGYPHASPVTLHRRSSEKGGTIYAGKIDPLEDRWHFYLTIHPQPATDDQPASLRAVLRNPERNLGKYLDLDRVMIEGTTITIRDRDGQPALSGSWLDAGKQSEVLSFDFPRTGTTIDFRRAQSSQDFAGVQPTLASVAYRYRAPEARPEDDERDWPVASAEQVGLDPSSLEAMVREIQSTGEPSVFAPYVHAVLVARHGKLVLEEYFYTQRQDDPHDTRSAGKSVGSMMIGAAIDRSAQRGDELALTTRFLDVFGDESPEPESARGKASYEERQSWRKQLTLAHLLSMSSGLDCDDEDGESPGNEGTMQDQTEQPDWTRWGLDLPMVRPPAEKAIYCSNSIHLAAASMARVTGRWLPDAFADWIAAPLGIDRYYFNLTPVGDGYMGGGIRLTARDQAKLGQVMLGRGQWKGERVLSEAWVKRSTSPLARIHEPGDYGYAWWRLEYQVGERKIPAFYASGNGGQLIIVVPELDVVVHFSAGNYGNFGTWRRFRDDLVQEFVLPAVLD